MNKGGFVIWLIGFLVILILIVGVGYKLGYAFTSEEETITVEAKWDKRSGDKSKYLVSTTDGQVFQITDSFVNWRFDSSNLYARIKPGETYDIKTQGFRFGLLSDYKNIIEVKG